MKYKYPEVTTTICEKFTTDQAKEFLENNLINRPIGSGIVKQLMWKIIKKRWRLNGEPIIVARNGQGLDGQHRCEALVMAEERRLKNPKLFKERYGWSGPITIPTVLVYGIDERVADTLNQGKKRSHGDVLYRMNLFSEFKDIDKKPEFSKGDTKKLARDLATAIRTVWLRVNGKQVSDAPKFDELEMVEFFQEHSKILDMVLLVYREDNGRDCLNSSLVSRAYLAAAAYLAGISATDRELYKDTGFVLDNWEPASDFVIQFSHGTDLETDDPALSLRTIFTKQKKDRKTRDRDEVLGLLIKAFDAHLDESKLSVKDLTLKKDEIPRLGGFDVERESEPEEEPEVTEEVSEPKKPKAGKKSKKAVQPEIEDDQDNEVEPDEPPKKAKKSKKPAKAKTLADVSWKPEDDLEEFDDEEDGNDRGF